MTIIGLIVLILVVGIALHYFPIDSRLQNVIFFILAIVILFAVLNLAGVNFGYNNPRVV